MQSKRYNANKVNIVLNTGVIFLWRDQDAVISWPILSFDEVSWQAYLSLISRQLFLQEIAYSRNP